eukprot:2065661-Rhodomonas_salina.1
MTCRQLQICAGAQCAHIVCTMRAHRPCARCATCPHTADAHEHDFDRPMCVCGPRTRTNSHLCGVLIPASASVDASGTYRYPGTRLAVSVGGHPGIGIF